METNLRNLPSNEKNRFKSYYVVWKHNNVNNLMS